MRSKRGSGKLVPRLVYERDFLRAKLKQAFEQFNACETQLQRADDEMSEEQDQLRQQLHNVCAEYENMRMRMEYENGQMVVERDQLVARLQKEQEDCSRLRNEHNWIAKERSQLQQQLRETQDGYFACKIQAEKQKTEFDQHRIAMENSYTQVRRENAHLQSSQDGMLVELKNKECHLSNVEGKAEMLCAQLQLVASKLQEAEAHIAAKQYQ